MTEIKTKEEKTAEDIAKAFTNDNDKTTYDAKYIKRLAEGKEAEIYKYKDEVVFKLYSGNLANNNDSVKLTEHENCFKGIDGVLPPIKTSKINRKTVHVFEYLKNGSLTEFLKSKSDDFKNKYCLPAVMKIIVTLSDFHKNGFIHNDIKLDNIFVDDENNPVLSDLGQVQECNYINNSGIAVFSQKNDIKQLGIMFLELFIKDISNENKETIIKKISMMSEVGLEEAEIDKIKDLLLNKATLNFPQKVIGEKKEQIKDFFNIIFKMCSGEFEGEKKDDKIILPIEQIKNEISGVFVNLLDNYSESIRFEGQQPNENQIISMSNMELLKLDKEKFRGKITKDKGISEKIKIKKNNLNERTKYLALNNKNMLNLIELVIEEDSSLLKELVINRQDLEDLKNFTKDIKKNIIESQNTTTAQQRYKKGSITGNYKSFSLGF